MHITIGSKTYTLNTPAETDRAKSALRSTAQDEGTVYADDGSVVGVLRPTPTTECRRVYLAALALGRSKADALADVVAAYGDVSLPEATYWSAWWDRTPAQVARDAKEARRDARREYEHEDD